MSSRNITLTLPTELVLRAKVTAAERDMSVSALVAELLERVTRDDHYDHLWRREQEVMQAGLPMRVGQVTWSRDDIHARD